MSEPQTSTAAGAAPAVTTAGSPAGGSTPVQAAGTPPGANNTHVPTVAATQQTVQLTPVPGSTAQPQQMRVMVTQQLQTLAAPGTSQMSMAPAGLTQIVASQPASSQVQNAPTAGAVIRSTLPQTVQVIQGNPFVQSQYMQQQYYIQTMQQPLAQQMNLTAVQGRPGSATGQKSPIISGGPGSQVSMATVALKTVAPSATTATSTQTKGAPKTVLQQINAKQVIRGTGGQPLVIGQLGVLQNAGGSQTLVAQPKSPSVSIGQGGQVINSPTQIRFAAGPTFVNSQGQILTSGTVNPAMLNQLQMTPIQQGGLPLGTQILGSQSAMIGTQPLYLRPAGSIQTQQGIVGSVQAMIPAGKALKQGTDASGGVQMKSTGTQVKTMTPTQVRGVANILPQTARPLATNHQSITLAKGVQTGQIKQVSRVRALRPTKTTLAVTATGQPARIAPQQVYLSNQGTPLGTARLFTPTMTRPPTVLAVQPKPQIAHGSATTTPTTSHMVTLATVANLANLTPIPIASIASTETQTLEAKPSTSEPIPVNPLPVLNPLPVKPLPPPTTAIKPEVIQCSDDSGDDEGEKFEEPMDTGPPPLMPLPTLPAPPPPIVVETRPLQETKPLQQVQAQPVIASTTTGTGPVPTKMISTGTGPPKIGGGMVGAGAGPDRPLIDRIDRSDQPERPERPMDSEPPTLGPPIHSLHRDRNVRVATVIGERQAAIVKPNVLTHVIEGFVIQEASEPFPVQRCSALSDFIPGRASSQEVDSGVEKDTDDSHSTDSSVESKHTENEDKVPNGQEVPKLKCEYCGVLANARRFTNSRRFCSKACSRRYNVGCSRRIGLFESRRRNKIPSVLATARKHKNLQMKRGWKRGQTGRVSTGPLRRNPEQASPLTMENIRTHTNTSQQEDTEEEADLDIGISGLSGLGAPSTISMETTTTTSDESERSTSPSGHDESSSPRSPPELERVEMDMDLCNPELRPKRHPSKWTVQDVVDFIHNLHGCSMYAEEFNRQEIDGQALMLLKEDHLMSTMNVKLGPALKICAKVKSLVEEGLP